MKLEDLERDILGAYLNYENHDLKTATKQLEISANTLLHEDNTLDPFWTDISKNVYKAVFLNNFNKGIELTLKDLRNMLNNQENIYNNIIEFCNKFENNEEIVFGTSLRNISENPLKSAIQILSENIDKIINDVSNNIKNDLNVNDNNEFQNIKCFCGHEIQVNWTKIPKTEKVIYIKCPNCDSELKRGNPLYKTEEKYPKISYGTFINIDDLEQLKIYNQCADKNIYIPKENLIIPEQIATNWILKRNKFDIISEKIIKHYGNNHDEEFYDDVKVIKEDFYYVSASRTSIKFYCKNNDKEFVLSPSSKFINIDGIYYCIPMIEVYGIRLEEIGLNNLKQ